MRRVKLSLTVLLVSTSVFNSTTAFVARASAVARPSRVTRAQSGAAQERDEGRALLHRGKAAVALIHLDRAREAFRAAGDKSGEASTLDLLGELYERQGLYDPALESYSAASKLYAEAKAEAATKSQQKTKEKPGKEAKGAPAAATLTPVQSGYNEQLMQAKIGNMRYRLGDAAGATAAYMRMRVRKPDTSAKGKVTRGAGLGGLIPKIGVGDDGNSIADTAVKAAKAAGAMLAAKSEFDSYRESILYAAQELGLGRLEYKSGNYDPARKHFENILEATDGDIPFIGKLGQTRRFRTAARTGLGDVAFMQGRYEEAEKLYEEAGKGAKEDGRADLMWPAQRGEGRSLWRRAASEKSAKKAEKLRADALDSYLAALDTIEAIREGSIRADESRTTFLTTTAEVFEEAAGAFAETALAESNGAASFASNANASTRPLEGRALDYAAKALAVAERGRARSLLDMLGETGGEVAGEDIPAALLQQKRENLRRQQEVAALLTGVSLGVDVSKDKVEDSEKRLGALQSEYEKIENQIRTASPRYEALTRPRPLALEDVKQQVLDDRTALLEYSLGEERSYLFAVTREGLTVSRLPARAEVERQVTAFRRLLLPPSLHRPITDLVAEAVDPQRGIRLRSSPPQPSPEAVAAYAQAARALYESVVAPAAPLFKQDRLLVVADGALNYVPFHALVNADPPQGADFSTLPYLLLTNDTVFAPSASVVAAVRAKRAQGADASRGDVLLVADPVFDASDSRVATPARNSAQSSRPRVSFDGALADVSDRAGAGGVAADASSSPSPPRGVLVRLVGTRDEAQEIAKLAAASGRRADALYDTDASESNVEGRDLRPYRVLHFATHGLLDAERPQFTGVVLSLVGNGEDSDGFLRTDEVFNLRLASPLVMLSACETGLGREKRGEGVMGLTRAFMYAGAPTVGVTLWSVQDSSTAELMADFYRNFLGGAPTPTPSDALDEARRKMIAGKRYSDPYYWAPFVLVGDWK